MNHFQNEDLVKDVFYDEELESLREKSLLRGMLAARSRRRGRALRMVALSTVPVLVMGVIWLRVGWNATALPPKVSVSSPSDARLAGVKIYPAVSVADAPPVKIISDEELLALYKDQPVGLMGEPGRQRLVVYDRPTEVR